MTEAETGGPGKLVFRQPWSPYARALAGAAGVLALSVPHELLIRPGVPLFQVAMIPFWIIGVSAGLFGALLVFAAVLGLTRSVTFDAETRAMEVDGNGSFGISWKSRYTFSDILELNVIREPQRNQPPRFTLQATVANASGPVEIDTFNNEAAAQDAEARINRLMLGKADGETY